MFVLVVVVALFLYLSILYVLPEGHRAELKNKKWFVSLEYS